VAIPFYNTAVTVAASLRPRLAWAQSKTGVLKADRRHQFLAASIKTGSAAKTTVVRVLRITGRRRTVTLPIGKVA